MNNYKRELECLRDLYKKGIYKPEFYSAKLKDISQFDSYDAFRTIPFTYKRELRATSAMERTTTSPGDIYGFFSSSGTTGEKTFYVYNKNDKKVHEEFVKTFYTELGVTDKDIGAVMAPVDTGVMAHTMMWQFTTMGAGYVNCPQPSPENMIDTVTKVPVTILATRPSIAFGVVYNPYLREKAKNTHVNKLLMGGGFLSHERRKILEDAWGADCYNMFGMSEMFGPMAGECRQKNGQHYLDKYIMIEIVDPETKEPVEDGQMGVAVYTSLWDKGFPLLRYWSDDLMVINRQQCPCGSANPRIFYRGRRADSFFIDGKYIFPVDLENLLFSYGYWGEYRAEKANDSYTVTVEGFEGSLDPSLLEGINDLFGTQVTVEVVSPGSLNYDGHSRRFVSEG